MELFSRLATCKFCGSKNISSETELLLYECESRLEIPSLKDSKWVQSESCKKRPQQPAKSIAASATRSGSSGTRQARSRSTATVPGMSKAKESGGKAKNAVGTISQKRLLPDDDAIPF